VYGTAQNDQKQNFLSELSSFCSNCSHSMLIGGDFNIIRKESNKNKPGGIIGGVIYLILLLIFMI
jgi:exonuclease III